LIASSRIRLFALAGALALAAAGCGGSGDSTGTNAANPPAPPSSTGGSSSDVLGQAATATAAAGTYKTEFTMEMDGGPTGPITLAGNGEFQADPPLGKVTMDFSAISGGAIGGNVTAIFDGPVMYMQMPGLGAGTTKSWFKIDTSTLGAGGLGQFSQVTQGDPTQTLQYLSGATGPVQEDGTEEIRGVETTKYRMTIDLNEAAEHASSEELKQSILETIEATGVSEVPAEVWIDGDGLVRKTVTHFNDTATAEGATSMTVTQEIYDFGEDVNIEVPADDEVLDFGDLGGLFPTTTTQQ
jgi:hypothetical protein